MRAAFVLPALLAGTAQAQHAQDQREAVPARAPAWATRRPAELNHFPGPMHVLELADQLEAERRAARRDEAADGAHKAQARALGAELVAAERELEQLFRSGKVDERCSRARCEPRRRSKASTGCRISKPTAACARC